MATSFHHALCGLLLFRVAHRTAAAIAIVTMPSPIMNRKPSREGMNGVYAASATSGPAGAVLRGQPAWRSLMPCTVPLVEPVARKRQDVWDGDRGTSLWAIRRADGEDGERRAAVLGVIERFRRSHLHRLDVGHDLAFDVPGADDGERLAKIATMAPTRADRR